MSRSGIYDPKYGFIPDEDTVPEKPPMTNADRVRAMTDEELATWLNCMQSNAYHCGEFGRTNAAYPFDNKAWLDWLKSPVEVDNG